MPDQRDSPLYDLARTITDEVMGPGTYAEVNKGNPDPSVQAAIKRAEQQAPSDELRCERCGTPLIGPHEGDKWCPKCNAASDEDRP